MCLWLHYNLKLINNIFNKILKFVFYFILFLFLLHWLVYTCYPGRFSLIFNILFFFSAIFISPLTLFSHRSGTFLLHEVNSSSSGSFIVFFMCSFYYIYVVHYNILFVFFLLGIRTIVNLWSGNKIYYYYFYYYYYYY